MTATFRVLIGRSIRHDLTGATHERTYPTWEEARSDLDAEFHLALEDAYGSDEDPDCPHCKTAAQEAIDGIRDGYVDARTRGHGGDVDVVRSRRGGDAGGAPRLRPRCPRRAGGEPMSSSIVKPDRDTDFYVLWSDEGRPVVRIVCETCHATPKTQETTP
jgi:hypothetical protein